MSIQLLDTVVLAKDLPRHGLKQGDVGAVVEVYPGNGYEVEFVTASGRTQAVVTLSGSEVRPVAPTDILAVRDVGAA